MSNRTEETHGKVTPAAEKKWRIPRVPRALFEGVTLILALLAIIFAIIQFGDSRGQLKQAQKSLDQLKSITTTLQPVAESVQTRSNPIRWWLPG